jgi:hypothetical protein
LNACSPADFDAALAQAMRELEATLDREAEALSRMDMQAIDDSRVLKDALSDRLSALWSKAPPEGRIDRATAQATLQRIRGKALDNHRRLEATLGAVRDLLDHLTGAPARTYGKGGLPAAASPRPILTEVVG